MLQAVHDQAVVDLIRKDHELVLACDVDDLLQDLARVERSRGVVGVDDDDGLGLAGDLGADVVHVREPVGFLVADVVDGLAAGKRRAGGPQRVVRRGDQYLVAVVEQGLHAQVDELRDAVAGVDVLDPHVGDVLVLGVLHDRLARGVEALGVGVALALGQLAGHVVDDLVGGAEAEGCRVADVEFEDMGAHLLHAVCLVHYGAAHVIEDVVELGGLLESHGLLPGPCSSGVAALSAALAHHYMTRGKPAYMLSKNTTVAVARTPPSAEVPAVTEISVTRHEKRQPTSFLSVE